LEDLITREKLAVSRASCCDGHHCEGKALRNVKSIVLEEKMKASPMKTLTQWFLSLTDVLSQDFSSSICPPCYLFSMVPSQVLGGGVYALGSLI